MIVLVVAMADPPATSSPRKRRYEK